jgi:Fe-S-cluster-containing dehydrogenase component/DMSO reductase anchor subunit
MGLPLLERAADDDVAFALTRRTGGGLPLTSTRTIDPSGIPARTPAEGEQYRFHFDMGKCIGCKCCVVACNEQNGNPASINWRRVSEIEGGWFPNATRSFLSMGCNHCAEPTCLEGCPVDAYTKDPLTGIVGHSADQCIGCQYCTWNCSYGVPQYNEERGVVGKCDMCHGRLSMGAAPACVSACPEGAIAIEIVNVAEWREALAARRALDGTADDSSISTTRVSGTASLPPNAKPRDLTHVRPEHPHWPLVVMTVLTQLSVGAFATVWLLHMLGAVPGLGIAAIASLAIGGLALGASTLHLGRPVHAYRAIRMWRRSWLSREVLLFGAFAKVAALYAAALWFGFPGGVAIGAATVLLGAAGVFASGSIYRVGSRPAWNTAYTPVQFAFTAAVLGPLFAGAIGVGDAWWLAMASMAIGAAQLLLLAVRFLRLIAADSLELRGTARLLSTVLRPAFITRLGLVVLGAIVLPLLAAQGGGGYWLLGVRPVFAVALLVAVAGEIVGRWLFFVSVVPMHMTAPYVAGSKEAA